MSAGMIVEWILNCAPISVSTYQRQSASELCPLFPTGSPPAPWMPTNEPPSSTHCLNAAFCASFSRSPEVLLQMTSLNRDNCCEFIMAPFSVMKYGQPCSCAMAPSAASDAWIAGSSRYPTVLEKINTPPGFKSDGISGGVSSNTGLMTKPEAALPRPFRTGGRLLGTG